MKIKIEKTISSAVENANIMACQHRILSEHDLYKLLGSVPDIPKNLILLLMKQPSEKKGRK